MSDQRVSGDSIVTASQRKRGRPPKPKPTELPVHVESVTAEPIIRFDMLDRLEFLRSALRECTIDLTLARDSGKATAVSALWSRLHALRDAYDEHLRTTAAATADPIADMTDDDLDTMTADALSALPDHRLRSIAQRLREAGRGYALDD
jgi:hypothetical protein